MNLNINSVQTLVGTAAQDTLVGTDGDDTLNGISGSDLLDGGDGYDVFISSTATPHDEVTMSGGNGNDVFLISRHGTGPSTVIIDGGDSHDLFDLDLNPDSITYAYLTGGEGQDTYRIRYYDDAQWPQRYPTIQDFVGGVDGDRIDVGSLLQYSVQAGTYSSGNFFAQGFVRFMQDGANTNLIYDADGSAGAKLGAVVAVLTNVSVASVSAVNLVCTGFSSTGAAGPDKLTGGPGDDTLNGGAGDDTMLGGDGNDVYLVDAAGDVVIEQAGGGFDRVETSLASYTLPENVENATVTVDTTMGVRLAGNAAANVLTGGLGDDTLEGADGWDTLIGGLGDDVYVLSGGSALVTEEFGGGTDTVLVDHVYQLGANIENAQVTMASSHPGGLFGNSLSNHLTGNDSGVVIYGDFFAGAGNDTLDGGAGNDTLYGEGGDDVFHAGGGIDEVFGGSGVDSLYVLDKLANYEGTQLDGVIELVNTATGEHIRLTDVESVAFTDVTLSNAQLKSQYATPVDRSISGTMSNDILIAGQGNETLAGGGGDDVYYVNSVKATISELTGHGTDRVDTTLTKYTLPGNVENLRYVGAYGYAGTGNDLDNLIEGGASEDTLMGGAGNDTLAGNGTGGWGSVDILDGGGGSDVAILPFKFADYQMTFRDKGLLLNTGVGDHVLLINIEKVVFADFTMSYEALLASVGTDGNDVLTDIWGGNYLDGDMGADTMKGGAGDDVYMVDNPDDMVVELPGEGRDTVRVGIAGINSKPAAYTLPANVENAAAELSSDNINLTGNELDNSLTGNDAANLLTGGVGNDTLISGAGNDTLAGGDGDDNLNAGTGVDLVDGGGGSDVLTLVGYFANYLRSRVNDKDTLFVNVETGESITVRNVESVVFADGAKTMTLAQGNLPSAYSDYLSGTNGNDSLNGLQGVDTLSGGLGDDTYVVDNILDVISENAAEGSDLVKVALAAAGTYVMAAHVEDATVMAAASIAVNITGNDLDNLIIGNAAANTLLGGAGNDTLDGGAGADKLSGGSGDDTYVVDAAGDVVTELANEGSDTVQTTLAAYTLIANVENLTYTGAAAFTGTGNALDNVITGGNNGNKLDGGTGNDKLIGGNGADSLIGGAGNDTFFGSLGKDTIDGGDGDNVLQMLGDVTDYTVARVSPTDTTLTDQNGNVILVRNVQHFEFTGATLTLDQLLYNLPSTGNDVIHAKGGSDPETLDGGLGADTMFGGPGDDTYMIDNPGDTIVAQAGWDHDVALVTIATNGVTYVLADDVEEGRIVSKAAINLTGSGTNNILTGNATVNTLTGGGGDDTLDGGGGADKLIGGTGDDIYIVNDAAATITEKTGEGWDAVQTSLSSYTMPANVETLRYTGTASFTGTGGAQDNIMYGGDVGNKLDGGAGNDELHGGKGNDNLLGGIGDDVFFAGGSKDTIDGGDGDDVIWNLGDFSNYTIARPNAIDTVLTDKEGNVLTVRNVEKFYFGAYLESLATVQLNIASAGNDRLVGTLDNDTLDGGAGADTMVGGQGDDTYVVDNVGDVTDETGGSGTDTAKVGITAAGASYTLGEGVENGVVTSTAAVNLTGNADNNVLTGNAAANTLSGGAGDDTLDGGAGADKLVGGTGEDIYIVADAGDVVTENADEGWDTVRTSLATYTMTANVEVLSYTGAAAFTGTGNAQDNLITGGNGGSKLDGGAGDDILRGGNGNDSLQGGVGNDQLTGGRGKDTIDGGAGSDTVVLNGGLGDYTITRPNTTDTVLTDSLGNSVTLRNVEFVQAAGAPYTIQEVQLNVASPGADHLIGEAGNDTMNGGTGVDTLEGGAGDDTYVIADKASVVVENPYEGVDLVQVAFAAAGTYVLSANVENAAVVSAPSVAVNLTGNDGDNQLTGNAAANTLTGKDGNDTLDGGAGADKLIGGIGDDTYVVADSGDVVTEAVGEGSDSVQTTLASYTLGLNVEDLAYKGNGAFAGTGNALDNEIHGGDHGAKLDGGAGNDKLFGGAGKDSLQGGAGDDYIFAVDGGADTIDGGIGNDTLVVVGVMANYTVTRTTASDTLLVDNYGNAVTLRNVEQVEFSGQSSGVTIDELVFNLPSPGPDHLYGYAGNDTLDGGTGLDTLEGYGGDDTYVIADTASVIIEDAGAGLDLVEVALLKAGTYALAANVEDAAVTAAASIAVNLTGNELDNYLTGNAAANVLLGGLGNDTLDGGAGSDVYKGGAGDDSYGVMDSGDTVTELADEGVDTVVTTLASYTLGANLEILQYAGTALFTGTGNAMANLIVAGSGGSRLDGGAGDDFLVGGNGNDSLQGGLGDDLLFAGAGKDTVDGGLGADVLMSLDYFENYTVTRPNATDTVLTHDSGSVITLRNVDFLMFAGGELTLAQAQVNSASPGADVLYGTEYGDVLDGGLGYDTMSGGNGDDYYTLSAPGDVIVEAAGAGRDVATLAFATAGTYTLAANVEDVVMAAASTVAIGVIGNALNNYIGGNAGANNLSGGAGNDVLVGGAGIDTMTGGVGDDQYTVSETGDVVVEKADDGTDTIFSKAAAYTMSANVEDMVFIGTGAFSGIGSAGDNRLFAGSSNGARLDGGAGDDQLIGGAGNDSLIGGLGDDLIEAGAGKDSVDGGDGFDLLYALGAYGSYVVTRPTATDTVLTDAQGVAITVRGVEYFFFDGVGMTLAQVRDNTAGIGNNVITGSVGNDVLDGGAGADTLVGGTGDDIYIVDNAADVITEAADEGRDQVKVALATGTYVMAANVEDAAITATAAVNVTGNALANLITGNAAANKLLGGDGDDTLDGGAGSDALAGGLGDDVYLIGETTDVVTELAGQGHDQLLVKAATYTLGANIEDMSYIGGGAFTGVGNALDNVIAGGDGGAKLDGGGGGDTLDGGTGNDSLAGGAGDDELRGSAGIDMLDGGDGYDGARMSGMIGDYVMARPSATDLVLTDRSGNVTTLRNVEYLYFADTDLASNQLTDNVATIGNDALRGTSGNDTINGLAGNDSMTGGLGDDLYIVSAAGDVIVEHNAEGLDHANVAFATAGTYVLADNLENATVTAAAGIAINLTGNALNNVLTGNAAANTLTGAGGNDTLNGGAGGDSMVGGEGDDYYVVDAAGDKVVETAGNGTDRVDTSLASYALTAQVEDLRYTGAAAFTGTGNELANTIQSGAGNDVLSGGAGDDVLVGGAGSDKLTGGGGADIFVLNSLAGSDTVTDFVSGTDHLTLNLAALAIGNGDMALDGAATRAAPGGFGAEAELVLFTQRMASASTANAAAVIGSATSAYAAGDTALFTVSTSTATTLYRFTSSGADAVVSAAELTQLVVLTGAPSTDLADYLF